MRHEVKEGTHTPCSASTTIAEAGAAWLAQAETDCLEASTVMQYRQHLNYHIMPFLGAEKVTEHVPASIQEFPQSADSNLCPRGTTHSFDWLASPRPPAAGQLAVTHGAGIMGRVRRPKRLDTLMQVSHQPSTHTLVGSKKRSEVIGDHGTRVLPQRARTGTNG